jgi:hypothetical protein
VSPEPRVSMGGGCATASASTEPAAPHTQNQGCSASRARKTRLAGSQRAESGASVMPSWSENQTGRRSVLTASRNDRDRGRDAAFRNSYWTTNPSRPSGLNWKRSISRLSSTGP